MVAVHDRLGMVALVTIKELYDLLNNIGGNDDLPVVVLNETVWWKVTDIELVLGGDPPALVIHVEDRPMPE